MSQKRTLNFYFAKPGPAPRRSDDSDVNEGNNDQHMADRPNSNLDAGLDKSDGEIGEQNVPKKTRQESGSGEQSLLTSPPSVGPLNVFDIAHHVVSIRGETAEKRYNFLSNVWRPDRAYNFPVTYMYGKKRSFRYEWLEKYPWLVYSALENGAYCLNCVLFGSTLSANDKKLDKLFKSPLCDWSTAVRRFAEHRESSHVHRNAMVQAKLFEDVMKQKTLSVSQQVARAAEKTIADNRKKLSSIVETIIFCGHQNIALRGHRDDATIVDSSNQGNFLALLDFRAKSGDTTLKDHLENAPRNATYKSKTIQNDIINCIDKWIRGKLVEEIKEAKYFAVLADEATDVSNKEQMSLVVRFMDADRRVREEFLGFVECQEGTSGEAVADLIITTLTSWGLDMNQCVCQCYDGAGNMAGKHSGAAARVKQKFPSAQYIHCFSHKLNLCVMQSCKLPNVRNMLATLSQLSYFFNLSPKRQNLLKEKIKELCPVVNRTKLLDVCKTRWVQRLDILEVFTEIIVPVMATLDTIRSTQGWNAESVTKANGLYHSILDSSFLMAFVVARECLAYTRGLTVKLQGSYVDLIKAYTEIDIVLTAIEKVRREIESYSLVWHQSASSLADALDVTIKLPRTAGRQVHRANAPATSPEEYYRKNLCIPFIDELLQSLNLRFGEGQPAIVNAFTIVPAEMLKKQSDWQNNFVNLMTDYRHFMPLNSATAEFDMWYLLWTERQKNLKDDETLPTTVAATLQETDVDIFPIITTGLRILGTLPATSCTCERSISALRRLKTYTRSTMGEDRLNGLALLHTQYKLHINVNEIIDMFARKYPRKMLLTDILKDNN